MIATQETQRVATQSLRVYHKRKIGTITKKSFFVNPQMYTIPGTLLDGDHIF